MNSEDFATDYPYVDLKFAQRLVRDHHLTIDDLHDAIGIGQIEMTKDKAVNTDELLLWLGY